MPAETTTVIVSVNANADEDARMQQIQKQVGEGWRVIQTVPLEGSTAGPGGNANHFIRLQATLQRIIEPNEGSAVGTVQPRRDNPVPDEDEVTARRDDP
jgi:hypothetical protein